DQEMCGGRQAGTLSKLLRKRHPSTKIPAFARSVRQWFTPTVPDCFLRRFPPTLPPILCNVYGNSELIPHSPNPARDHAGLEIERRSASKGDNPSGSWQRNGASDPPILVTLKARNP